MSVPSSSCRTRSKSGARPSRSVRSEPVLDRESDSSDDEVDFPKLPKSKSRNEASKLDLILQGLSGVNQRFDTVNGQFDAVKSQFDSRFDTVKSQFDTVNSKFDSRFDAVNDTVNTQFATVSSQIDHMTTKFDTVYSTIDVLQSDVRKVNRQIGDVHTELATQIVETQVEVRAEMNRVCQEVTTKMSDVREEVCDIRDRLHRLERPLVSPTPSAGGDASVIRSSPPRLRPATTEADDEVEIVGSSPVRTPPSRVRSSSQRHREPPRRLPLAPMGASQHRPTRGRRPPSPAQR